MTLTTAKLAAEHGVTTRTVRAWTRAGCPTAGQAKRGPRGGRPELLFDARAVETWLVARGTFTPGMEGRAILSAFTSAPDPLADMDLSGLVLDCPGMDIPDLLAALEMPPPTPMSRADVEALFNIRITD